VLFSIVWSLTYAVKDANKRHVSHTASHLNVLPAPVRLDWVRKTRPCALKPHSRPLPLWILVVLAWICGASASASWDDSKKTEMRARKEN